MVDYEENLMYVKNIMKQWIRRNFTVIGRITLVRPLVIPVLNYLIVSLQNPSQTMIFQINELFCDFVLKLTYS